jgi:hypothetical protein
MTKAAFIKRDGALWPMDDDGRELMASLRNDRQVVVNVHAPRNIRHLRLYFHLLNRVVKSGAWAGDKDTLEDWIKIGVHHVRIVVGPDGKAHYVPKSIAVESMPQDEFRRFFDRAIYLICSKLLGREDWEWLRDEISEAVDGGLTERMRAA